MSGGYINTFESGQPVGTGNPLPVTMLTTLSSQYDSINVDKMTKGGTALPLNAIVATTTSAPIDLTSYRHVSIEVVASAFTSGNYVVELLGCNQINGTFGTISKLKDDGTFTQLKTPAISSNGTFIFEFTNIGVKYLTLRATRTTDGTLTAKITPYN